MTPAQIKLKRTESILKELIPEAISQLSDARVREVDVIDVHCSRGRSDAKVYLDPHDYTLEERNAFLKLLEKARPIIEEYCMKDQGWFRSPRLTFVFDDMLERSKNIEALFAQIAKEKKDES
ncbi:30S ribosome-binding factor RbfA [Sulfuricurvum sp.]|uniref:30S ribosome-binding factor RbfA n=1 Tax=Sulfuricurvum sp. TaxID=2025608 RepID=UPI0019905054|nr:30S ribosome-binding factor RbfA [Sulfuricurvum sp.]MBD3798706.1 30S ribosome-binding factor RbfA [Campylobacterota bacterium]MBD3806069.1 30S ribosome-binding factor RbfA [Sulfuricurvum sp.]